MSALGHGVKILKPGVHLEETFDLTVAFAKSDVLVEGTILSKEEKS